jgi:hypothetical protein
MSVVSAPQRALVASFSTLVLAAAPLAASADAKAPNRPARLAETFQAGEVKDGRIPSAYAAGADWGLTVDTIYMLAATDGRPRLVQRMGNVLARNAHKYTSSTFENTTYRGAGATAKVLLAARVLGRSVRTFGGVDYRARLATFIVRRGVDTGRLSDRNSDGSDFSNTLTQSLGVIGFARSGSAPQVVVRHLLEQQCPRGYFTLYMTKGQTCRQAGGGASVDATAYAIQAMLAAKLQGGTHVGARRITKAVRWLVNAQGDNGSFGSDRDITTRNANSTGLAALALVDAGRDGAAMAAARFVSSLQVTRRNAGEAKDVIGAIAYDRTAFKDARGNGVSGETARDQFRRATAQGAFAFAPEPMRILSAS